MTTFTLELPDALAKQLNTLPKAKVNAAATIALAELVEDSAGPDRWKYLAARPGSWKRQFFLKGRKLTAAQVWLDMQTNRMTREEAAANWDLPLEAIDEAIRYSERHLRLIERETAEEKIHLESHGVKV